MDKGKQVVKGETSSGIFKKLKLWGMKKADVEIIDMEQQFELFNKVFKNLKHGQIYGKHKSGHVMKDVKFKHFRERRVSCTDENQQVSFNVVDQVRYGPQIKYVHLGGIMIAVKGVQRSSPPGAKTIVALYDGRFIHAEDGVIGTHEIEMSTTNGAIIYFRPNFPIYHEEFQNNIKVGIKTKGYEELERGVENLMIRTGFIGKMCASAFLDCKITKEKMGKMLAGKGLKAVPGREYTALEWNLETFYEKQAAA